MSVVDPRRNTPPVDYLLDAVRRGAQCFYCWEPLSSPAVHWMGAEVDIVMHPGCCVELAIRLFRDVHQIECETHIDVTSRTTEQLRRRLLAEESK